ncbi:lipoprotein [Streptomyces viridochromogenes DSM 40736]|uniref:Lipoprotein n=1 Tax=Streptomyces viridochromogenes (strain DSM 40736 / JCM 4977 / BCRC 1201 / Tue 494) TaxID=591159 RepID=D9X564_STRVT|nr:lipoprotein [Streptomyces viridochromogenes DSM 40736]
MAAVGTGFVLTACGGGSGDDNGGGHGAHASASEATAGAHNAQDVSFAQGMIPHHRQALEMARLADGRASSGAVKDLAARIEKAQDPEIKTMTGWLKSWGEDVPAAGGGMEGMDHSGSGHGGMPGMMGEADMAELEKSSGNAFDTKFLALMVEHHQGAVEMATVEKSKGGYGPAKAMAEDIITAQNAEIGEMNKLLGKGNGESGSKG